MAIPSLVAGTDTSFKTTAVGASFSNAYDSGSTGSDRALAVGVLYERGPTPTTISSVTYNSVSATKKMHVDNANTSSGREDVDWWFLANPATGSNTLTVNVSNTDNRDLIVLVATFQDVDQSTITGNTQSGTGASDPGGADTTVSLTTGTANSLVVTLAVMNAFNSGDLGAAASDTLVVKDKVGASSAGMTCCMVRQNAATTGAYTTGFNSNPTSARDWVIAAIELLEASGAAASSLVFSPKPMQVLLTQ